MAQLTVRDVPEDVLATLRGEAEALRVSLNTIILNAIREHEQQLLRRRRLFAALPGLDQLLAETLSRRHGVPTADSVALLREDRGR